MNETAKPRVDDSVESMDQHINLFTDQNAAQRGCGGYTDIKTGQTPTFYAMLLFHRGFCDYAFDDTFSFLHRNDPYFGTFGQLACLMTEQCYVMPKQLNDLKDGGWKLKPQFAKYLTSLDGIPIQSQSDHSADREFFDSIPDTFIKLYGNTLNKAVLSH